MRVRCSCSPDAMDGFNADLDCSQSEEEEELEQILCEDVEVAVASLKNEKSAGVDDVPSEYW